MRLCRCSVLFLSFAVLLVSSPKSFKFISSSGGGGHGGPGGGRSSRGEAASGAASYGDGDDERAAAHPHINMQQQNWTTVSLKDIDKEAVCINGMPATLKAFVNPVPSTTWVINIGGTSPQTPGWCVDLQTCLVFGKLNGTAPKPAPIPPPTPIAYEETLLGQNCSQNPDFCAANKADLSMCDFSLGLGNATHSGVTTFFSGANTTSQVWFKGRAVLRASIAKLATLGLSKARRIVLTGIAHGGTAVYLNADFLSAAIKKVAPSAIVKALPVDAMHPRLFNSTLCMVPMLKANCAKEAVTDPCVEGSAKWPNCSLTAGMYDWYPGAIAAMIKFANASSALSDGCKAAHKPEDDWLCAFPNYTMPFIKTPVFTVQQMVTTWDAQCMGRGQIAPPPLAFIQIQCSVKAMHCEEAYTAVQYPDLMAPADVRDWWVPYQQKYLDDYTTSGAHNKPGNGGFFHHCFLGAYFYTTFSHTYSWNGTHCAKGIDGKCLPRPVQGLWNELAVGGTTMRAAISTWWNADDSKPALFVHDLPWDPDGKAPTSQWPAQPDHPPPIVPWYTSRYISNPTCRGMPWYSDDETALSPQKESKASSSPNVAKFYQLDSGICLNGDKASLFAYHEPADQGLSQDWVIQIGGPPELNWCIDPAHCAMFAKPAAPGTTCSTNASLCPDNTTLLGIGGPLSTNCTDNPDFCHFNMAQLDPACTMDMFLGDGDYHNNSVTNFTMHFDGLQVLESSIAKLGLLGLRNARRVLLTGVAHAGTMVYLHADRVYAQITALNPRLQTFKALPVDGFHPKLGTVMYAGNDLSGPRPDSWLTTALQSLGTMVKVDQSDAVLPGCKAANPGAEWKCLYVNETLPYINASLFAVNQMLSVWDSQCQIEGIPAPNSILQVHCSLKGPGWATARQCNQYPEFCTSDYVGNITAPYQQQYVEDYARSRTHTRVGNGGFFHSCYLGSYFQSGWEGTAIWNIISIGGLTMREAISNWWHDDGTGHTARGGPVHCRPKLEHCPGGAVCPSTGVCPPSPPSPAAAWHTDCTWSPVPQEPPPWTNKTCEDWQYNANQTGKPGCYVNSCCPPEDSGCRFFSCTPRPPWANKWYCNPSCGEIQVYY
eukprot:SAG31_NODE_690_length_12796_cov_4.634559_10_plen_1106_part_00